MRRLYGVDTSDEGFVLPKVLREQEAKFISEALAAERGIVSHAAKRLGIRHQTLIRTLQTRHKQLIDLRTPAQPRRKRTPKR